MLQAVLCVSNFTGVLAALEAAAVFATTSSQAECNGGKASGRTLGQQAAAPADLLRQLAAALARLQVQQGELESRMDAGCTPAQQVQQVQQLQQLLPLAAELAVLLQQHWQQPEEVAALGLELAHIAATRSCAHLQCSNVEAEGGSRPGQQPCLPPPARWLWSSIAYHTEKYLRRR